MSQIGTSWLPLARGTDPQNQPDIVQHRAKQDIFRVQTMGLKKM
jgi:hypothetical protein